MRDSSKLTRAELVRRRRERQRTARKTPQAPPPRAVERVRPHTFRSETPRPNFVRPLVMGGTASQVRRVAQRRQYDSALTPAGASSLTLPRLHAGRLVSGALALGLAFLLYTMWNAPLFQIEGAQVYGNQRLGVTEINAALRLIGEPIFKAVPAQIEATLRADYPDLARVKVQVGLPNQIVVNVVERTPIITWHQDEQAFWIDAEGVRFPMRGESTVLIDVFAVAPPPALPPVGEQEIFLDPALVRVIATVFPYVPPGTSMVYDPSYGVGWKDPRGWAVYFGQNVEDIPLKLRVYQAVVDRLVASGITPTLISVEHLEAPFYK